MTSSTPRDDSRPGELSPPGLDHTAHSKEAGALVYLQEELGDARMRCDQLLRYVEKAGKLIEKSSHKDHFFEVAGDLIRGIPETVFKLHKALEAVALAANRIDYEEIKQDLRPEKVEELERVLKDVRVRQVQRRSLPMVNPPDAVQQLKNLAKKAKEEGQLDIAALGNLIAALEGDASPKIASGDGVAAQLEAMAHALENPPKGQSPSRQRLAQALRKTYGEHVQLVRASTDKEAIYRKTPDALFKSMKDAVQKMLAARVAIRDVHEDLTEIKMDATGITFTNNVGDKDIDSVAKELYDLDWSIGSAFNHVEQLERKMKKTMVKSASSEDAKRSRFEEGKPADPTENMDPEDAKAWKSNTEEYGDKFKKEAFKPSDQAELSINAAIVGLKQLARGAGSPKRVLYGILTSLAQAAQHMGQDGRITAALQKAAQVINMSFSTGEMRDYVEPAAVTAADDEKRSRFEEGKPADPTENMDPADAKDWEKNTDKYKDKFKKEAGKKIPPPDQNVIDEIMSWHGGQGTTLYAVGSSWHAGRSVDADDAEEVYDYLERKHADDEALDDLKQHLKHHGVTVTASQTQKKASDAAFWKAE